MKTSINPTFFRPVQTLCNLVPGDSFPFDVRCQNVKRPWRRRLTSHLLSRPLLMPGLRSCFKYRLFGKLVPWFYKKKKKQKKMYHLFAFHPLDCNISFCMDFLHHWLLLLVKKNKYATLSMHCFFLNLRLNFDLQLMEVSQCLNKPLYI